MWTGSNIRGGNGQIACEENLTPEHGVIIMRRVGPGLEVDGESFYPLSKIYVKRPCLSLSSPFDSNTGSLASLYSDRHLYTPKDNRCFKNVYKDIFCSQLQGELPNAATLHADANVEGYLDANLLGTNDASNYGFGLDSSLANSAPFNPNSNSASGNLFESGNNQQVLPDRMQQNFISDASVVPPSQAAANNPVVPDFGNLLGGTNLDFSGSGNIGGTFNNQNTLPSTNIDNSIQEAALIPSGSDQTGGNSFGNISPPNQANNFLQYVPDVNVQALGEWS